MPEIILHHYPLSPFSEKARLAPGLKGAAYRSATIQVGRDPLTGELLACDADEIVIRRSDPRAGSIHRHFPRAGFDMAPAA